MAKSELRFLSDEMGMPLGDVGFMLWMNDTKEVQQVLVKILDEEREFKKTDDIRFNPERQDMAEVILVDLVSQIIL